MPSTKKKISQKRNTLRTFFPLFLFLIVIGLFLLVYWVTLLRNGNIVFTNGTFTSTNISTEEGALVITKDNVFVVGAAFVVTGVGSASVILQADQKQKRAF